MIKPFALVALLAAVVSAGTLPQGIFNRSQFAARLPGRIINGIETTIEKNPHQVSIRYGKGHWCGGSIISKHWVLTAAHCLDGSLDRYSVLAGTADRFNVNFTGSIHKADRIVNHPDFGRDKYGGLFNDVALLHVLEPFEFGETRQPIELFNKNEEAVAGTVSVITGWGSTELSFTSILNLVEIPIISKADCAIRYSHRGGIREGQICAGYAKGGKDSCKGDSGGPLTIDGRLAGIVSWGVFCALPAFPGVYTEVAYFRDWIRSVASV